MIEFMGYFFIGVFSILFIFFSLWAGITAFNKIFGDDSEIVFDISMLFCLVAFLTGFVGRIVYEVAFK